MLRNSHLIYTSTISPVPEPELQSVLDDILMISVANNRKLNITGALLAYHGRFAQILEGGLDDVTTMYRTICADTRHFDQKLMILEPIEHRRFGAWAMCVCNPLKTPIARGMELHQLTIQDLVDLMEASISTV